MPDEVRHWFIYKLCWFITLLHFLLSLCFLCIDENVKSQFPTPVNLPCLPCKYRLYASAIINKNKHFHNLFFIMIFNTAIEKQLIQLVNNHVCFKFVESSLWELGCSLIPDSSISCHRADRVPAHVAGRKGSSTS